MLSYTDYTCPAYRKLHFGSGWVTAYPSRPVTDSTVSGTNCDVRHQSVPTWVAHCQSTPLRSEHLTGHTATHLPAHLMTAFCPEGRTDDGFKRKDTSDSRHQSCASRASQLITWSTPLKPARTVAQALPAQLLLQPGGLPGAARARGRPVDLEHAAPRPHLRLQPRQRHERRGQHRPVRDPVQGARPRRAAVRASSCVRPWHALPIVEQRFRLHSLLSCWHHGPCAHTMLGFEAVYRRRRGYSPLHIGGFCHEQGSVSVCRTQLFRVSLKGTTNATSRNRQTNQPLHGAQGSFKCQHSFQIGSSIIRAAYQRSRALNIKRPLQVPRAAGVVQFRGGHDGRGPAGRGGGVAGDQRDARHRQHGVQHHQRRRDALEARALGYSRVGGRAWLGVITNLVVHPLGPGLLWCLRRVKDTRL